MSLVFFFFYQYTECVDAGRLSTDNIFYLFPNSCVKSALAYHNHDSFAVPRRRKKTLPGNIIQAAITPLYKS